MEKKYAAIIRIIGSNHSQATFGLFDEFVRTISLRAIGMSLEHVCRFGYLDVLKMLHEHGRTRSLASYDVMQAAIHGHLDIVRYCRSIGVRIGHAYISQICQAGHLDVLIDLVDNDGATLHVFASEWAAGSGNLDMMNYIRDVHRIECSVQGANNAAKHGHIHIVDDLWQRGIRCDYIGADAAAGSGQLEMVRALRERGIHCTRVGADGAAANGHLKMVQDLREHGIHCTASVGTNAAINGHLHVVKDLYRHGINFTPHACFCALANGRKRVVKFLLSKGIFDPKMMSLACAYGDVEIVRMLVSNGFPLSEKHVSTAACHGKLEIVQLCREHGFLCTSEDVDAAAQEAHYDVVWDVMDKDGIYVSAVGADFLVCSGNVEMMRKVYAHGIHCTQKGLERAKQYAEDYHTRKEALNMLALVEFLESMPLGEPYRYPEDEDEDEDDLASDSGSDEEDD